MVGGAYYFNSRRSEARGQGGGKPGIVPRQPSRYSERLTENPVKVRRLLNVAALTPVALRRRMQRHIHGRVGAIDAHTLDG